MLYRQGDQNSARLDTLNTLKYVDAIVAKTPKIITANEIT